MKKIIVALLVLVSIAAMGGCMPSTATKTVKATDPAEPDKIVCTDYKFNIEGLCEYLDDLGYMVFDYDASKDEAGATVVMEASMIGAEKGYKSTYTYNKENWSVEAYYYSSFDSDYYHQAEKDGKITLTEDVDGGTFDVVLSNYDGRFALVVHAPNKNDASDERKEAIITAFQNFYPEGTPRG